MAKAAAKAKAAKKTVRKPAPKKPVVKAAKAVKKAPVKAAPAPVVKEPRPRKSFSPAELEHFKSIILEKRKEILEELESLKSSMMDVPSGEYIAENSTYSLHMEQGTDAMEREKTFLFASREGKFLNYLNDALKRIEKGNYGYCTECGSLIDKERLEAVPHTQMCVDCKVKKGGK